MKGVGKGRLSGSMSRARWVLVAGGAPADVSSACLMRGLYAAIDAAINRSPAFGWQRGDAAAAASAPHIHDDTSGTLGSRPFPARRL